MKQIISISSKCSIRLQKNTNSGKTSKTGKTGTESSALADKLNTGVLLKEVDKGGILNAA